MAASGGVGNRTKDGVPIWDGEAASFNDFEEACLMYEQSVAREKRYLTGPKILAELTGSARRLVAGKSATWLSFSGGVQTLLRHLRACLGRPQISELSDYLNRYFKHSKRRQQETINDYVTRKCEIYLRAQQALRRVAPFQASQKPSKEYTGSRPRSWAGSRRSSFDSIADAGNYEGRGEVQSAAPVINSEAPAPDEAAEPEDRDHAWSWSTDANYMSYWSGGWQSYEYGSSYGNWDSWRYQPHGGAWSAYDWHRESDMAREEEMPELLPDYVQGWYLLQDAGLTIQEKNVVQTALQGDFSLQRVAQELRNQWSGNELLRREPAGRQGGYLGEYLAEDDDDEGEDGEPPDVNF